MDVQIIADYLIDLFYKVDGSHNFLLFLSIPTKLNIINGF